MEIFTKPTSTLAKKLDGSYVGFQPKPATEVILVVMKPLSEKTYVEQAMNNEKGISWFDDCRIPFVNECDIYSPTPCDDMKEKFNSNLGKVLEGRKTIPNQQGRFSANLLVSDDVLNNGIITKSNPHPRN